ncbi:MAG: phosphatidylglycerol lysyltransferase domain-containing protein [Deltaproteobacteria bacterium]|jgi:hypothetical protein|nr:phosphatidylglycerol lysyltransferase domain-containing protein [Deltaproteobacteria bacterium]
MIFQPLTLESQPIFRALERDFPLATSDANFTNVLIWNDYYHIVWTEAFGCLCLLAHPEGGEGAQPPFAFPPLGGGDKVKASEFLFSQMDKPLMARAPEAMTQFLAERRPTWKIVPDSDNDDYVYLAESLITLSGRRMHQKKNHYNYFVNNYQPEYVDVTEAIIPELMALEDLWLTAKTDKLGFHTHLSVERRATRTLLTNLTVLGLSGLAIRLNGQVEAFTIGERLNPDTAVIHAEKGNPEIRGIYVALCSEYCRRRFSELTYINREQDLGLPGLRFSKESLKPHHMAKKYLITP